MNAVVNPTDLASAPRVISDVGIGTLSFVADSDECFGQLRFGGATETIRGTYSSALIALESGRFTLTLAPNARPAADRPALRGAVIDRQTGETAPVVAWRPTKGGKAYGLSLEVPLTRRETNLPF